MIAREFPKASFKKGGKSQNAVKQVEKVFVALGKTNRNSRSSLESVLAKATDFREDIGAAEKRATMSAILNAWEVADYYGAFDQKGRFLGQAHGGRFAGTKLVWENIIPAETAPEFAGYVGNLRLVPSSKARKKDQPPSFRDQQYLKELQRVRDESVFSRENVGYRRSERKTHAARTHPI